MSPNRGRARLCDRLARHTEDPALDGEGLRELGLAEVERAIGFDLGCWSLADPDSLLGCSGMTSAPVRDEAVIKSLPTLMSLEQHETLATRHAVARASSPAQSLHAATSGTLAHSRRWSECLGPLGFGDVLVTACRDAHGCWGWLEAYRSAGDPPFTDEDRGALARCSQVLGTGLRRRAEREPLPTPPEPPPAVLVLDAALRATSWTPSADDWLERLPSPRGHLADRLLPTVVYAVAGRARRGTTAGPARARVATNDGRWATVEGALLRGADADGVAITLRPAGSFETLSLISRVYGLTPRERQLAALVSAGYDTSQLAERLFISRHTVKDHLKAIFAKVDVRTRCELTARITGVNGDSG